MDYGNVFENKSFAQILCQASWIVAVHDAEVLSTHRESPDSNKTRVAQISLGIGSVWSSRSHGLENDHFEYSSSRQC